MRFNPKAQSDGGTERRSGGGTGGFGIPGVGGGGRLSIGGVLVVGAIFLVSQLTGVDLTGIVGGSSEGGSQDSKQVVCTGADANNARSDDCAISLISTSVQKYWTATFDAQVNGRYERSSTVIFAGSTSSGCGTAQAAMGPFYCPNDRKVYIDTDFMDDMLEGDLGAKGGTFALAYVVAHEYGHHVENLLGLLAKARSQQGPKSDSVKIELMADCLGGMWAKGAQAALDEQGNAIVENLTEADIANAIDAATAVGDDRIQQRSGGTVSEESWTHGSSKQRVHWFQVGLQEGTLEACDTFAPGAL